PGCWHCETESAAWLSISAAPSLSKARRAPPASLAVLDGDPLAEPSEGASAACRGGKALGKGATYVGAPPLSTGDSSSDRNPSLANAFWYSASTDGGTYASSFL